jgi:hypothetical protein
LGSYEGAEHNYEARIAAAATTKKKKKEEEEGW